MMATRQAARLRRRRLRLMVGTPLALAAAGVLACLVVAFLPDREVDAGQVAAKPGESTRAIVPSRSQSPTTARTPTATSTPAKAATSSAAAAATTAAPKPSATRTSRSTSTTASLAGRIRPGTTYSGVATTYDIGTGDGACSFGPTDDVMIAAMNTADYESSKACGAYVLVRAANGASVTVRIVNECPAPCTAGQLDLSAQAFTKLADLSAGKIPITWKLLSPSTSDTISIRYKTGSSRYWCAIQAIGHRNPVARLEVRTSSGWQRLARAEYNYFLSENGSGCGGAIRITDIYGEQLTVNGAALRPDVVQPTGVQFARH